MLKNVKSKKIGTIVQKLSAKLIFAQFFIFICSYVSIYSYNCKFLFSLRLLHVRFSTTQNLFHELCTEILLFQVAFKEYLFQVNASCA